jgi:hypothetical protein
VVMAARRDAGSMEGIMEVLVTMSRAMLYALLQQHLFSFGFCGLYKVQLGRPHSILSICRRSQCSPPCSREKMETSELLNANG